MESKVKGLKLSSDFQDIQRTGKRKILSSWLMVAFKQNQHGLLRFGCTISKKVGPAVVRNRLKRWTREYFRHANKNETLPELDINLVFKARGDKFYKELEYTEFCKTLEIFFK